MEEVPKFIPVGELAHAFSPESNLLEPAEDLAGRSLSLHFEDGQVIEYRFLDRERVSWSVTAGPGAGETGEVSYSATAPRPGIYLVDRLLKGGCAKSETLVLDLQLGIFTAVISELPSRHEANRSFSERIAAGEELTSVGVLFRQGSIGLPLTPGTPRHQPTLELVGKRVEYSYSPTELYEHIYLNPHFYAWHCLRGSEQGLCDTDRCHYYKIANDLYLFVWREKIVPTLGLVLVDLRALRTTGKIFGYQGNDFTNSSNFPVGARARIISAR